MSGLDRSENREKHPSVESTTQTSNWVCHRICLVIQALTSNSCVTWGKAGCHLPALCHVASLIHQHQTFPRMCSPDVPTEQPPSPLQHSPHGAASPARKRGRVGVGGCSTAEGLKHSSPPFCSLFSLHSPCPCQPCLSAVPQTATQPLQLFHCWVNYTSAHSLM